jgi:hypothetical protein
LLLKQRPTYTNPVISFIVELLDKAVEREAVDAQ